MKSILKFSLAATALGLSAAAFLRADDQPVPPAPPPAPLTPDTTPGSGEKPHRDRRMNPEHTLQMLSDQLSLTDDEKAKILPLLQTQNEQMKAIFNDDSIAREDKREKMRALMKSTHDQIRALLTLEQQGKFDEMRPPHGEHGDKDKDKDAPPPPPPPAPSSGSTDSGPPPPQT